MYLVLLALLLQAPTKPTIITDARGHTIATMRTRGDGTMELRNARGQTLGRFHPKRNLTVDRRGKTVGKGNQLMRLVPK